MELRHNGTEYEVSPWALSWDDENYYLIAFDSYNKIIKHFRVDKMLNINANSKKREGKQECRSFDMAVYAKKVFGMYGGEEEWVKIECENSLVGVIIDRFGKEITIISKEDEHFIINVQVVTSRQFLAWIIVLKLLNLNLQWNKCTEKQIDLQNNIESKTNKILIYKGCLLDTLGFIIKNR